MTALEDHSRLLYTVVSRFVGRGAEAEDLVQETLLRALSRPPTDDVPLAPWLVQVARNLSIDHLRRHGRIVLGEVEVGSAPPDETRVGLRALLPGLGRLSPGELRVVLLREALDLSVVEVADVLETTPATVSALGTRARARAGAVEPAAEETAAAGVDGIEAFLGWLLAREVAGLPVRGRRGEPGVPDPAHTAGVLSAHAQLLDGMVEIATRAGGDALLARAHLVRGTARTALTRLPEAAADLEVALAHASRARLRDEEAVAAARLAWVRRYLGQSDEALVTGLRGLRRARRAADRATLHALVGRIHADRGDHEAARPHFEALEASGADLRVRQRVAATTGLTALTFDRFDEATGHFIEAIDLALVSGDLREEAAQRVNLSVAHLGAGRYPSAGNELLRAERCARQSGDDQRRVSAMANLALLAQLEGRYDDAASGWSRVLAEWRALGLLLGESIAQVNIAVLDLLRGDPERAVRGLRDADGRLSQRGQASNRPFAHVFLAAAEAACGRGEPGAFARARQEAADAEQSGLVAAADLLLHLLDVEPPVGLDAARAALVGLDERGVEVRTAAQVLRATLERRATTP